MSELTAQKSRLQTEAGERRAMGGEGVATPRGALTGATGQNKRVELCFGGRISAKALFQERNYWNNPEKELLAIFRRRRALSVSSVKSRERGRPERAGTQTLTWLKRFRKEQILN